jgi:lipopolysaccharide transport system ATP-binding protein
MSRPMVDIRGVSKAYRIGRYRPNVLRERIAEGLRNIGRREPESTTEFWALKNVSVTVGEGEVVGLIGKNGAGKSTLLKVLSRITEPTSGEIHLYGRTASLLEVGIGFHPELTGRENVYLNGAILGMSRAETRRKFDDIVAFSEIEKFLDTAVKRYSSGMYVRLAFAVAAHLDPDILIVDEVLGVGDAAFQQKCLSKIRDIQQSGRTVIVVSHNTNTIATLCHRVVWLQGGEVIMEGATSEVLRRYLSLGAPNDFVWTPREPASGPFEFHSVEVRRGDALTAEESVPADVAIDIVFDFTIREPLAPGHLELRLVDDLGEILLTSSSADGLRVHNHEWKLGRQQFRCRIPQHFLAAGRYFLSVSEPGSPGLRSNVISFSVSEENSLLGHQDRPGKIAPLLAWSHAPTTES